MVLSCPGKKAFYNSYSPIGSIKYIDRKEPAKIIYIKTTVTNGLFEDIYEYCRANPSFLDQSTADQFFDEAQLEAYRELGFQAGEAVASNEAYQDIADLLH